jgi:hypothetical protein
MAPIFRSAYKTPAVYPAAYPKYWSFRHHVYWWLYI